MSFETLMRSIRILTPGGWFPCLWNAVSAPQHPATFVRLPRLRLDHD